MLSKRQQSTGGWSKREEKKNEVVVPCLFFYLSLWGTHDALSTSSLFLFALLMCIYAATHINNSVSTLSCSLYLVSILIFSFQPHPSGSAGGLFLWNGSSSSPQSLSVWLSDGRVFSLQYKAWDVYIKLNWVNYNSRTILLCSLIFCYITQGSLKVFQSTESYQTTELET